MSNITPNFKFETYENIQFWLFYAVLHLLIYIGMGISLIFKLLFLKISYTILSMFHKRYILPILILILIFLFPAFTEENSTASISDGENIFYYATLHEAFEEAAILIFTKSADTKTSIENPVEINLLADVKLDEPLIIPDGAHIRLTAGGADKKICRSENNLDYPVIWVKGASSSLTLGKHDMEYSLIIDGGYLKNPEEKRTSIQAHAPLVSVNGPGAKLIMYDNVIIQNNYNIGEVSTMSNYQNGAGVFIRTAIQDHDIEASANPAEFIMKGGTIRGNINDVQNPIANGGGLTAAGYGTFRMEGGKIMNNIAQFTGGGICIGSRASFYKTGGIIYGANAPKDYRNTALEGSASTKTYGHAVIVHIFNPLYRFRNKTVKENDNLSYTGAVRGNGTFNDADKWDDSDKTAKRIILVIILLTIAGNIAVFFVVRKIKKVKQSKTADIAKTAFDSELKKYNFSAREKEICKLLLTELTLKEIGYKLGITYSGVSFHSQKIYRKLNIQSRTELFVKLGKN